MTGIRVGDSRQCLEYVHDDAALTLQASNCIEIDLVDRLKKSEELWVRHIPEMIHGAEKGHWSALSNGTVSESHTWDRVSNHRSNENHLHPVHVVLDAIEQKR